MQLQKSLTIAQDPPRLGYSVAEASRVLGLASSSLWKWIALGKIRSIKIGNRRVVPAAELHRVLSEGLE